MQILFHPIKGLCKVVSQGGHATGIHSKCLLKISTFDLIKQRITRNEI